MSRPIKLTKERADECIKEFENIVRAGKFSDGKVSYAKTFADDSQKATVIFTPEAYLKMTALIQNFDKEIAWHGAVQRAPDKENTYTIYDIMVYPQTVTAATVDMDEGKYAAWICENLEDDRFSHIYMQGHSHVNMGVSPSGVDLKHQESIVDMLDDSDFYIFLICNKSMSMYVRIFDMEKNILFETKDVTVEVRVYSETMGEFLKNAQSLVENRTYGMKAVAANPKVEAAKAAAEAKEVSESKDDKSKEKDEACAPPGTRPKVKVDDGWFKKKSKKGGKKA